MPVFQGTVFQQAGAMGWTTIYYLSSPDFIGAQAALDSLITSQAKIQTATVQIPWGRISDVDVKGDGILFVPTTQVGQIVVGSSGDADFNLAAHFQFNSADFKHRVPKYIHGLDAASVSANPSTKRYELSETYRNLPAVALYISDVQARCVNWQGRSHPAVSVALSSGALGKLASLRRVGRPFDLPRGRRRTA